ncbi:MAG: ABC transporter ATP-binding protein [Clostridia bacterium]|nr:ABC transporter ATP-binding protein [Clostridia bacterium]
MISIKNVSKFYDKFKALDNVSIEIPKGTIHGLIGENGAGKTTLIHCLTGIYKCDEGIITYDGKPVYDNPEVKSKIGYVADSNSYFPNFKIIDMVNFYKGIYPAFDEDRFYELNNIFKLVTQRKVKQLSKGMQMRLALMLNLSLHPDVLILDEPTSGLDAIAKKQVIDLLISEVTERECTIVISSHHLRELEMLCDSLTIIQNGAILYQNSIDKIKKQIVKLQAVFREAADLSDINGILNIEQIGSIYYIITDKNSDEITQQLYSKGADLVEQIGMSLEDIFIYTSENKE